MPLAAAAVGPVAAVTRFGRTSGRGKRWGADPKDRCYGQGEEAAQADEEEGDPNTFLPSEYLGYAEHFTAHSTIWRNATLPLRGPGTS